MNVNDDPVADTNGGRFIAARDPATLIGLDCIVHLSLARPGTRTRTLALDMRWAFHGSSAWEWITMWITMRPSSPVCIARVPDASTSCLRETQPECSEALGLEICDSLPFQLRQLRATPAQFVLGRL